MNVTRLAVPAVLFGDETLNGVIESVFRADDSLGAVLVLGTLRPDTVGLVDRGRFLAFLCGRLGHGRALYSGRPISSFEPPLALVVHRSATVVEAAVRATARGDDEANDPVVVALVNGFGLVPVSSLFKSVTEQLVTPSCCARSAPFVNARRATENRRR